MTIVRSETGRDCNGDELIAGDRVRVKNGKNKGQWVFKAHCSSASGDWLEVFGQNNSAPPATRAFHAHMVERIPPKKPRSKKSQAPA